MREEPLFTRLSDYTPTQRLALAIGVFDGVHVGHQALLREARQIAASADGALCPAALTFDPHPAALFAPRATAPLLLGTLPERARLLRESGAEQVIVAPFDAVFAALTPHDFVRSVLGERLHAGAVIVGGDFQYGRDRAGDVKTLTTEGRDLGFVTQTVAPVSVDGVEARSTTIREKLRGGDVAGAAHLLGRAYALSGMVVAGRQLGRTIGFPTANLESAPDVLVPAPGVYAGRVRIAGDETPSSYRAAISIGDNPTVAPEGVVLPRTVEAFLLDGFDHDIYGRQVTVLFVAHLRPMEKYNGLDALVAQMHRDVASAKERLG